jgi:hypothetical protein
MQSAKLFLQSSELGLPQPLTRRRVCPLPSPRSGGRGTLAGERRVGRVPSPTRGHTRWYSLYICTLCTALSVNTNTSCNKIKQEALTFPLLHRSRPDFLSFWLPLHPRVTASLFAQSFYCLYALVLRRHNSLSDFTASMPSCYGVIIRSAFLLPLCPQVTAS